MKKNMICLLVVALGIIIIPAGFQNAEAAKKAETAKKTAPARVKGLKAEVHEIAGSGGRRQKKKAEYQQTKWVLMLV